MKTIKCVAGLISVIFSLTALCGAGALAAEDFKGPASTTELTASFMGGFGLIDTSGGFALTGALAKKIANRGFAQDINNPLYLEVEVGPMFTSGITTWMYGTHLRWDFVKDSQWTFFALGGIGANTVNYGAGSRFAIYPRFGVGAFYDFGSMIVLRAEVSHEQIVSGISVAF